ncbi:MAG: hypothetical protein QOD57_4398 [Actinomycetota bacterium]|nr:hypothetical protein [Actinomycetota bacterium]MDQ1506671.1 hypothetical protein [Actinomycetota bacterium]
MRIAGTRGAARLFIGGLATAALAIGALAPPASASSSGWESILGGHIRSGAAANKIAAQAKAAGFRVHVQRISATNWEAEIFNGGRSKSQAVAVCAKANKAGLAHCSVEQEFHGNGWG